MLVAGVGDDGVLNEVVVLALNSDGVGGAALFMPVDMFTAVYGPRQLNELYLNGGLDLQVWHEQNLDAIEREMSAAGRDITARRYPGLNHLFQPATTGSITEYARIETTFDEQVMRDIVEWIRQKLRSDHADVKGRPEGRAGRKVIR